MVVPALRHAKKYFVSRRTFFSSSPVVFERGGSDHVSKGGSAPKSARVQDPLMIRILAQSWGSLDHGEHPHVIIGREERGLERPRSDQRRTAQNMI
jgi:hypothetical protein